MVDFISEFRNKGECKKTIAAIAEATTRPWVFMEVCGGHTAALLRFGIAALLPKSITLVSGPGCPVCVTATRYIDHAIALARIPGVVVATFGDLIRVPGSTSSLEQERSRGADVRIVGSSLDALTLAQENPSCRIVFLGIGFETTAPTTAAAILRADKQGIGNFSVLSSHKIMPPAMAALIDQGVRIDGYLCPGHVSAVTGTAIYTDLVNIYKRACVISGFEPLDILMSVLMLVRQCESSSVQIGIEYARAVRPQGNLTALKLLETVFSLRDDWWRGLGVIPKSGLGIAPPFARFDAESLFTVTVEPSREPAGCCCGLILKGQKKPVDCPLFGKTCTPQNPVGACMVSDEGACATYYKFRDTLA